MGGWGGTLRPSQGMSPITESAWLALALFGAMLLAHEGGRRVALRRQAASPDQARAGSGAIDAAVFGLLGLMIAFTFTSAATRFERRRELVLQETNAIGTAWMRLDLLAKDQRAQEIQDVFRHYVDARIAVYKQLHSEQALNTALREVGVRQQRLWALALQACERDPRPQTGMLVLPCLNEMFDLATARVAAGRTHVPAGIILMLWLLAVVSALVAGNGQPIAQVRPWFQPLVFAFVTSLALYATLDLEYPRMGLIRVDAADRILLEVRESMK